MWNFNFNFNNEKLFTSIYLNIIFEKPFVSGCFFKRKTYMFCNIVLITVENNYSLFFVFISYLINMKINARNSLHVALLIYTSRSQTSNFLINRYSLILVLSTTATELSLIENKMYSSTCCHLNKYGWSEIRQKFLRC